MRTRWILGLGVLMALSGPLTAGTAAAQPQAEYDAAGRLIGYERQDGKRTVHYDSAGRMTGYDRQDGSRVVRHDSVGRTLGYDRQQGNRTIHYDSTGRIIGSSDKED
jgi:YD repeat-containing protein